MYFFPHVSYFSNWGHLTDMLTEPDKCALPFCSFNVFFHGWLVCRERQLKLRLKTSTRMQEHRLALNTQAVLLWRQVFADLLADAAPV